MIIGALNGTERKSGSVVWRLGGGLGGFGFTWKRRSV